MFCKDKWRVITLHYARFLSSRGNPRSAPPLYLANFIRGNKIQMSSMKADLGTKRLCQKPLIGVVHITQNLSITKGPMEYRDKKIAGLSRMAVILGRYGLISHSFYSPGK
eukprot:5946914-Pleurochrysis_carterae.AAC.1